MCFAHTTPHIKRSYITSPFILVKSTTEYENTQNQKSLFKNSHNMSVNWDILHYRAIQFVSQATQLVLQVT